MSQPKSNCVPSCSQPEVFSSSCSTNQMSFVQEGNVEYFQPADASAVRAVHLRYDQLEKDEDLSDSIAKAYGFDGLGILVVTGVPNFEKLRSDLLPLAHKFNFT